MVYDIPWTMTADRGALDDPNNTSSSNQHAFSREMAFSILVGGFVLLLLVYWQSTRTSFRVLAFQNDATSQKRVETNPDFAKVPFLWIPYPAGKTQVLVPPDRAIQASLAQFRVEASQAMQGLSQALETALELEHDAMVIPKSARLSTRLESKIKKMNTGLEKTEHLLEWMLSSFEPINALPTMASDQRRKSRRIPSAATKRFVRSGISKASTLTEASNVYDSASQVVAHLVRDWTKLGAEVRQSLYAWCVDQLNKYYSRRSQGKYKHHILVPGAGLGRLAYDISLQGYIVEANELSPVMAAAAQTVLHQKTCSSDGDDSRQTRLIYPFLLDHATNEVDSTRRFDSIPFPDCFIQSTRLSFTVADFAKSDYYWAMEQQNAFSAVVTCFFLDTATNIYEYLELISHLISPGGIWVNVGPLQWHANALLVAAADELQDLIQVHFRVLHWSIDTTAVPYRDSSEQAGVDGGEAVRSTNFQAYRPLRFVAVRR